MKVIAEVGSNWRNINDCHESIAQAKDAGADMVKFQLFTPASLYGPNEKFSIEDIGKTPYLHPHWLPHLASQAKSLGIEFLCSAFSSREYELVNEVVNIHKIASAELTDTSILKTVNSFKKPVFLSTGGSNLEEISCALSYLKDCHVTIFYCVADYPAKFLDLDCIKQMRDAFGPSCDYGYSDHSLDLMYIPTLAKYHGASVIEKHVRLSAVNDTPDAPHSATFDELKLMVKKLKGEAVDLDQVSNKQMKKLWKRRFIALYSIDEGERFKIGNNVGIYRAKTHGEDPVSTFSPTDIENKRAKRQLRIGDVVCYHDVSEDPALGD